MRRTLVCLAAVSLAVLSQPVSAQDDGGNVTMIHCMDVKEGSDGPFEEGVKKHMDWHGQKGDSWSWTSWTITTGPDSDRFCTGTFGRKWADFDSPDIPHGEDTAHAMASFGAYIENHEAQLWSRLADVSRPADEPLPISSVVNFQVEFDSDDEFTALIGEFREAIERTGVPWRYDWYALASGGDGGTYALVLPYANFAQMAPSGKTFHEVLEEAYGRSGAEALLDRWRAVVTSSSHFMVMSRPDLSYLPEP